MDGLEGAEGWEWGMRWEGSVREGWEEGGRLVEDGKWGME